MTEATKLDAKEICGWDQLKLQWDTTEIVHGNDRIPAKRLRFEPPSDRIMTVPVLVPMADRGELMLVFHSGYPSSTADTTLIHYAMKTTSRDEGKTWTPAEFLNPGELIFGITTEVCYLGYDVLLASPMRYRFPSKRYRSVDGGKSWEPFSPIGLPDNFDQHYAWDPPLVHDGKIYETAYIEDAKRNLHCAYYRVSNDGGLSFSEDIFPPEWTNINEVRLCIKPDGSMLAGMRGRNSAAATDQGDNLLISRSQDGVHWSEPEEIAPFGRMHPSFAMLPDGRIVLSYVVREGYPDSPDGAPRYGIEAVISEDGGKTWDTSCPYILAEFTADHMRGADRWASSVQSTESLVMPDGSILIAFGDAHRAAFDQYKRQMPRDIQLMRWKP